MMSVTSRRWRSRVLFCGLLLAPLWGCNDSDKSGGNAGGAGYPAGGGAGKEAGGGAVTQTAGGSGGTAATGGAVANGAAGGSTPTGGSAGTTATGGSGGMGGTPVDPEACPSAPQGQKCDVTSCNYNIGNTTGRCLCNNDFFVCAKLPAPDGSAACPANPNQTNCRPLKVGTFCRLTELKFCVCQSIGASDLWACP